VKYWQCFPNHRVPHQKCTQKLKKDWILPMSTNGVIRKAMYSARFSEPHIQSVCRIMMEPDIPWLQVWTTLYNETTFFYETTPTTYNFVDGWRTTATYELYFIHGWCSISLWWYNRYKKLTLLVTQSM